MNSRERILAEISANQPAAAEVPVISLQEVTVYDDPVVKFKSTLEGIGGKVIEIEDMLQLESEISRDRDNGRFIINAISEITEEDIEIISKGTANELESLYKSYIRGSIAVAENGAVWIRESQMINRLLPFICQHLVVVVEKNRIVSTMHHAYQAINSFEEGFGVFLAGPSKTADIEQSLVIGAHGARSLTVYLVN